MTYLHGLPTQFPTLVSLVVLGSSYEGRELLAVKITGTGPTPKKAIWFDGLLHAREWIGGAVVLWMMNQLLVDYATDTQVKDLVDNLDIYILPVFNPDGYAFTWTDTGRMWRKTRSPNEGSSCIGTDPNRNWDFEWDGEGVSHDPCSDAYLGGAAFSEVEVKTIGQWLTSKKGSFGGYINFHSYSQLWMSPWGYTSTLPPDWTVQNNLGQQCVNAIKPVNGTDFDYGNIADIIYPASGSSADYTYAVSGIIYSYGVELRDTGQYGFLLPPDQIVVSGQETYAAVKVWAKAVLSANSK